MSLAEILMIAALGILCVAALCDLARMEIPNSLSILLLILAVAHAVAEPGIPVLSRLAALAIMLLFGLLLFARSWMGGGDIKLLTATAPFAGLSGLPLQLAAVAIAGGLLALVMLLVRAGVTAAGTDQSRLPTVLQAGAPLPYAVAIAAGTIFWAWRSALVQG